MSSKKAVAMVPSSADKPTAVDVARLIANVENPAIKLIRGIERCVSLVSACRESTDQSPAVTKIKGSIQNILELATALKKTNEDSVAWHFLRGAIPNNDFPEYDKREEFFQGIIRRAESAIAALPTGRHGAVTARPLVNGVESTPGVEGKIACALVVSLAWEMQNNAPAAQQTAALDATDALWRASGGDRRNGFNWRNHLKQARERHGNHDLEALAAQIEEYLSVEPWPL